MKKKTFIFKGVFDHLTQVGVYSVRSLVRGYWCSAVVVNQFHASTALCGGQQYRQWHCINPPFTTKGIYIHSPAQPTAV